MADLKYKSILDGADNLQSLLADLPNRVQNRVFRFANRKAGNAVADRERQLTPRNAKGDGDHLADRVTSVQRVYRSSNTTVQVVGPESGGKSRIAHLVESGSQQRFTNHKTSYRTAGAKTFVRLRKVRTASGGFRTVRETVTRNIRVSAGSKHTGAGPALNRGRMPAFYSLARAVEQTPVAEIMETEIRNGLQRIADRQAG